ncbi:hypothetical protein RvY_06085 [Ramazzottius varieornatus]|uniref:Uncharacterized protein n=1 Tax=Ramazzottius varieornatus TaxID=947166 RepID=A0A1D1UXC1_RAMVA|nr:hypothetical protein RvY_06085 [Ramazzottius varieornatus]
MSIALIGGLRRKANHRVCFSDCATADRPRWWRSPAYSSYPNREFAQSKHYRNQPVGVQSSSFKSVSICPFTFCFLPSSLLPLFLPRFPLCGSLWLFCSIGLREWQPRKASLSTVDVNAPNISLSSLQPAIHSLTQPVSPSFLPSQAIAHAQEGCGHVPTQTITLL